MTDIEYMQLALAEAKKAKSEEEIPIGAVIAWRDTVLAAAHNLCETEHDPTAHAEILAIRRAAARLGNWRLTECTLYVTIEPCAMCAGAIMNARLGRLVYGSPDEKAGGIDSRFRIACGTEMNHHLAVSSGILSAECRKILLEDFHTQRQTEYGDVSKWS